ncbi:MAG: flagellar export chaperone FliS [Rhodoferax sp.]|uniref:flagellar export chaperone FliS n=1 Tax=Rhodoferax sp. TaxID=50421 RepID=UPI00301B5404
MTTSQARAASAYASVNLDSRANSSGGVDLVILLIEGVLDRIKLAKLAIAQRDVMQKIKHLNKALEIIGDGLRAHLDVKSGGEIALNLDDLYSYCSVRLLHANSKNDVHALDEICNLLNPLLGAWITVRSGANGSADSAVQSLADVTRSLKSAVPSMQRLYGSSAYASHSARGV